MLDAVIVPKRFRRLRQRAGLSVDEAARRIGVQAPCIWDVESFEEENASCYSPVEVQRFCRALGASAVELFDVSRSEPAVSARELAERIHSECQRRGVTLKQFEALRATEISGPLFLRREFCSLVTCANFQARTP